MQVGYGGCIGGRSSVQTHPQLVTTLAVWGAIAGRRPQLPAEGFRGWQLCGWFAWNWRERRKGLDLPAPQLVLKSGRDGLKA